MTTIKASFLRTVGIAAALFAIISIVNGDSKVESTFFSHQIGLPLLPDIPCKLAGKDAWCQIDTGSSMTIVDHRFLPILTPTKNDVAVSDSRGNQFESAMFDAPTLEIESFKVPINHVAVHDLSRFNSFTGMDHSVILGSDALQIGVLLFDFDSDRLAFLKKFEIPINSEWETADLSISHSVPFVHVSIADREYKFLIDTGSNSEIDLSADLFDALVRSDNLREAKGISSPTVTAGGIAEEREGEFVSGTLFGHSLKGIQASTTKGPNKFGMGFLYRYNFAIDFLRREIHFDYRESFKETKIGRVLGLTFAFAKGSPFVYDFMSDDETTSPALAAGLKKGDRIARLGSLKNGGINIESIYLFLVKDSPAEIPFEVIRGDSTIKLTLKPLP
ncbi:MAG: hypothetical protein H7A54_00830 [Akkermansiaceae bacterium]|nr:hypothetical protein [Akkermansiaceae bacterium]